MRNHHKNPDHAAGTLAVCPVLGWVFLVLLLVALPGGTALAETGKKPDQQAALRGAKLYKSFCQSCHGERGVGETVYPWNVGKPGYFPAPALDDSQHAWHHSDEDLLEFIREGSPRTPLMPAWKKNLSDKNIRDIIAYMKSLWSPRALECQGPRHMSCM
ncbi:MAG: cytochrome c [Gammaproteobacteria bacterium]|nr:cytochrome c [Gammaproteobacteria bacterium]